MQGNVGLAGHDIYELPIFYFNLFIVNVEINILVETISFFSIWNLL